MRAVFGAYELDTEARSLRCCDQRVSVQARAFDLLAYLIEHRDHVVSADELLDALWPDLHVTPAALSTAVQKARQAVGDDGAHQRALRTEHGRGFRFVADVRVEPAAGAAPPVLEVAQPPGTRARWAVVAGVVALLLAAVAVWLSNRPSAAPAPAGSVAVLPFANLSGGVAADAFTAGIHDDVLTQISKIRDLKVIARTSVERLDPGLGIQEIGERLGVAAVLEGGVQQAGDRIRINVQLVDCETRTHLWAETYDRELTAANLFGIQSEIATAVANALRAALSTEEQERIATVPTENLAAYQAYLLGKQRLAQWTSDSLAEAGEYFQRAIELDPNFALAYVGLADVYVSQVYMSGLPFEELIDKAQAAAGKALELDDRLGEAYTSLGGINFARMDTEGAEAAYRRALELSPNYATAYSGYGDLLRNVLGRPEEALALHRKAIELDPLSAEHISALGKDLSILGRSDEALAWYEGALAINPEIGIYDAIADHYWYALGQLDEAVAWVAKGISLDPGDPALLATLGWLFLNLGAPDEAESWIERSLELGPESTWPNEILGLLHLHRDDESALDFARKSFAEFPQHATPRLILRNHALRAGRYSDARALYEETVPELLNEDSPQVDNGARLWGATGLALILPATGEQERADLLLERSLQFVQTMPRLGWGGYGIFDVEIYALQGEKQKALAALRQAIDEGWRGMYLSWWYYLQREPNLESLHGEPEFQALVAEIEADMAAQLARVREMQRRGELTLVPRSEATAESPSDHARP